MKKTGLIILGLFLSIAIAHQPAAALEPIPNETGFSGYIRPGVGSISFESNLVAGFGSYELSEDRIDDLDDEPDEETTGLALLPFKLAYTFADSRTQLFVGTDLSDLLRFDVNQQVGIKQEAGQFGTLEFSFLFSGIPTEVWEDPYVVGVDREETDRTSSGARLVWDRIFDSGLELQYTYRNIEIDDEESGTFLGLSASDQKLLEREGSRSEALLSYRFKFAGKHVLTPAVRYAMEDLDGDAMSNTYLGGRLTYAYSGDPIVFTASIEAGNAEYDDDNPIFLKEQDDDYTAFQAALFYKNPWDWRFLGSEPISFYVSGAVANSDANIDFYDQAVTLAIAGVLIKW